MNDIPEPSRETASAREDAGPDHLAELMREIRDGSAAALKELMDRLWPELVRFCAWQLGDADMARDIAQEAFIHLWSHRNSWVQTGSPRGYLYRVVRHQIIDERRRRKVRADWAERERLRPLSAPPTPVQMFEERRAQSAFEDAVASLPERRREVFYLVVFRGLSHREVAEALDISEQTVANQVSAALNHVRSAIRTVSDKVF